MPAGAPVALIRAHVSSRTLTIHGISGQQSERLVLVLRFEVAFSLYLVLLTCQESTPPPHSVSRSEGIEEEK